MKKFLAVLVAALTLAVAHPALASVPDGTTALVCSTNADLQQWYVNGDETARLPQVSTNGVQFSGDQLLHRAPARVISLADLDAGTFAASTALDQDSFFSIEVRDATTGGYGTMRWNTGSSKWDIVIGAKSDNSNASDVGLHSYTDPADAIGLNTKWGKLTAHTHVLSFGVGFTANPPSAVTTVVSSVTFDSNKYDMKCPAPVVNRDAGPIRDKVTSVTRTSIVTRFNGAANAGSYRVYLDGKLWKTVTGSPFTVSPLKPHSHHTVGLQAVSRYNGTLGPISNTTVWTLS